MARVSEVYGGNWLEKEDIGDRQVVVTIESITIHEMNDGKRKAAVHFVGKEKALLVNVTNATAIEAITGTDEMDAWVGTRVCLYTDPNVMYQGKRVGGLRVKAAAPTAARRPAPPPPPTPEVEDNTPDFDDSVPF
jgi:hypothetical protein